MNYRHSIASMYRISFARSLMLMPLGFGAALFVYFLTELRGVDELALIGSYHLHAADIATVICSLGLLLARKDREWTGGARLLVFAIVIIALADLLQGIADSPFLAFYDFRSRGVVLIFMAYVALSGRWIEPIEAYIPWIVLGTIAFGLLFIARSIYGATLFLDPRSFAYLNVQFLENRPLNADSVLFLDCAMLLFLQMSLHSDGAQKRLIYGLVTFVIFAVVALSRQRTATIAGLAGLLTVAISDPKALRKNILVQVCAGLLFLGAMFIFATGSESAVYHLLPDSVQDSFRRTETLTARMNIWSAVLDQHFFHWDLAKQLFGRPSSEALDIITASGYWKQSVHSAYIATLLNYGVVGSFIWATLYVSSIVKIVSATGASRRNYTGMMPSTFLGWLVVLLIYGYSYEWRDASGMFLAMPLAVWPHIRPRAWGRKQNVNNSFLSSPKKAAKDGCQYA